MRMLSWIVCACIIPSTAFGGLTNAERKSQFEKALSVIISAATPQVPASVRERIIKDYLEAKLNKGLAVQLADGQYFRHPINEDQTVVADRTLESCQLRFAKPCVLIAVNDEIVSDGGLISKEMPRLNYAGKYDVSQIPIIRSATRKRPDVQNYDKAMEPKAMAIHPWGRVFMSVGNASAKEAQETALAKCNNDQDRNGRDGRCFVYAVNNDVVLSERRIEAK
jgi:hypothetical protein